MELKLLIFGAGFACGALCIAVYAFRQIKQISKEYTHVIGEYKKLVNRIIDTQKSKQDH